jgi:hypothetical protein
LLASDERRELTNESGPAIFFGSAAVVVLLQVSPSFAKRYANVGKEIQQGLNSYRAEVAAGTFPGDEFAPYKMKDDEERAKFAQWSEEKLKELGRDKGDDTPTAETKKGGKGSAQDGSASAAQDETIKVY